MHLYVTKSYDEFTPYRNHGCMVDVPLPLTRDARDSAPTSSDLGTDVSSTGGRNVSNATHVETGFDCVSRSDSLSGPLVNTAADTCASVAEATASGLSVATSLASSLNAPAPLDEITGFESGYHVDKESNIIVLLGSTSAYVIALQGTDEMFSWAETMSKIMTDSRFRVTLRLTEGGKLSPGIQGSLHVQHWRLCLIGEPSAGCKFICSWRLDAIEQAHTMTTAGAVATGGGAVTGDAHSSTMQVSSTATSTATTTTVGTNSGAVSSRGSFTSENNLPTGNTHRVSLGNLSVLSASGLSSASASATTSGIRSGANTRPKHLLRLEANHSAGKGRGIHTFELDGGSLPKLTLAIEQLMALRYNPNGLVGRSPFDPSYQHQQQQSLRSHINSNDSAAQSRDADTASMLDLGQSKEHGLVSSSYSSDASGSRHSISPAQCFSLKQGEHHMTAPRRHSPLTMPVGPCAGAAGLIQQGEPSQLSHHIYGQSVPVATPGRCPLYYNLNRPYSNLISSSSSLSPPDGFPSALRKHSDDAMVATAVAAAVNLGFSQPVRSVRKSVAGFNEQSKPSGGVGMATTIGTVTARSSAMQFSQQSGDHLVARSASPQESESLLLTDDIERHLSQSVFVGSQFTRGSSGLPHHTMHATTWSHATSALPACGPTPTSTANYTGQSGLWRRTDEPHRTGASSGELSSDCHLLGEEPQRNIAHVASGVIISNNPLNPHTHRSFGTGAGGVRRAAPPLPPPLRDTARARTEAKATQSLPGATPATTISTLQTGAGCDPPNSSAIDIHKSLPRPCRCHRLSAKHRVCRGHSARHEAQSTINAPAIPFLNLRNAGGQSQGVFTADEDLWDAEDGAQPPVPTEHLTSVGISVANAGGLPTLSAPVQCPSTSVADTEVTSTWSATAVSRVPGVAGHSISSPTKIDPSTTGSGQCCFYGSPKSHEVLELNEYRMYRHRCRQYRVCCCPVLQTRSLSSDASLVLEFGNQPERDMICRDPVHSNSFGQTTFRPGLKHAVHSLEDFGSSNRDHIGPVANAGGSPPFGPSELNQSGMTTTCSLVPSRAGNVVPDSASLYLFNRAHKRNPVIGTAGRARPFQWLFHRKHSKSHDNLPINYLNSDKLEPVELPILSVTSDGDLGSRHRISRRSYSDLPATQLRSHEVSTWIDPRHVHLILRCPRHGSQPYRPLFALLRHSVLTRYLCSYCRKRVLRLRPPTTEPVKHSRRCLLRHLPQPVVGGGSSSYSSSSVLLNLKQLLHLRRRTREIKRPTASSGEQLELSCFTGTHGRTAGRSRTLVELDDVENRCRSSGFPEPLIRPPVPPPLADGPTTTTPPVARVSGLASSSPKYGRCRHCERHSRSLHSVLLACSEPSVSRFGWPVPWESRSHHSSLSSLLTCRSFSASSSLSACQGPPTGDCPTTRRRLHAGSDAKATPASAILTEPSGTRGSIDLIAETRSCSLCDTDDLSSGSVCEECCLGHEHPKPDGTRTTTHAFVDYSLGAPTFLVGHHSSADAEPGATCRSTEHYYSHYAGGKLKQLDRRTLSLCNPPAWFAAGRSQTASGPGVDTHPLSPLTQNEPIDPNELDKFYAPPPQSHLVSYSQRASTLPSTRILRSQSERTGAGGGVGILSVSGISGATPDRMSTGQDSVEEDEEAEGEEEGDVEADEEEADGGIKHRHRQLSAQQHQHRALRNPGVAGFDRLFPLLFHRGSGVIGSGSVTSRRRLARHNTMTSGTVYNAAVVPEIGHNGNAADNHRKLSSQSDVVVMVHQFSDDVTTKTSMGDRLLAEVPNYCNVTAIQRGISPDMPVSELNLHKSGSTHVSTIDVESKNAGAEMNPSCYVNLPVNWPHSTSSTCPAPPSTAAAAVSAHPPAATATSSLTARFKHLVQSFHHPSGSAATTTMTSGTTTGPDSRVSIRGLDLSLRGPSSRTKGRASRSNLDVGSDGGSGATSVKPQPQSVTSPGSDLSTLPAEVRDPSRNYAIVDLRPSPASSVNANTELTLGASYHHHHHQLPSSRVDEITSAGSSAASMLGFCTSTSTGSDCTSDAATLTSDTMEGYAPPGSSTNVSQPRPYPGGQAGPSCPTRPVPEFSRRRHSHSLSSAVPDPPVLNYVHVIAATAPFSTPSSARRDGSSTVSEPIVCSIPEQADSHSSSSGLGGIASHSITPPLAPASSASFGEIFTSRSMTSSATSSGEGANVPVDAGFQSYSPPDQDSVAYTQIDFTRTMALGELSGDMVEQQQEQQQGQTLSSKSSGRNSVHTPFRRSQHKTSATASSAAVDRSTSVRKSLSRSIRSIRSGNPKKPGVFLN